MIGISVVYPAYNESAAIGRTLEMSFEALQSRFDSFEIIVVNDCSRDDTGAIAEAFAKDHPQVRVVHHPVNKGQGAGILTGFSMAKQEWVLHNGVDYPFDLKDLDKLTPLTDDADIVVAMRNQRAGYTAYRKLTSVVNVKLLNLLFPLKLRDYSFVQLYRTKVVQSLLGKVTGDSTVFLAPELLFRAHDGGYRIRTVDIDYYPRTSGVATAGHPKVILRSLRHMLKYWTKRKLGVAG